MGGGVSPPFEQDLVRIVPYLRSASTIDTTPTQWTNDGISAFFSHFISSIPNSDSYNSTDDKYKKLTITKSATAGTTAFQNIISQTDIPFDIRIYGVNHSEDFPNIETRSLLWTGLSFAQPRPPDSITFISELFNSYHMLVITMKSDTVGAINSVITEYAQFETLASGTTLVDTSLNDSAESKSNIESNQNFTATLNNLRAGTKYNYRSKTRNTLFNSATTAGYSDFLQNDISDFTHIPTTTTIDYSILDLLSYFSLINYLIYNLVETI